MYVGRCFPIPPSLTLSHPASIKWVDDFLVLRPPSSSRSEDDFERLSSSWGVPWNEKKRRPFATVQRYIGFDWNLADRTVSFPADKRLALLALIDTWLRPHSKFDYQASASLHGKLVHAASILRLARPFIPSVASFAESFNSRRSHLHPPSPLLADLSWIHTLLLTTPATLPLSPNEPFDFGWWGDASTSFGVGIAVGGHFAVWKWREGFQPGIGRSDGRDIGWAEAVAVELGLSLLLLLTERGELERRSGPLLLRSDNMGIVHVVGKGRSRSPATNEVLRRLYKALAHRGLSLSSIYVASSSNITDSLSRGDISAFLHDFPTATYTLPPLPLALHPYLEPLAWPPPNAISPSAPPPFGQQ